ncbi:MAG: pyrroline-5-carboxylate reductase [Clostridia bacterium]|nr:pyrroline-5-carboxylate reductase [Clostridia bacterium]
MKIGVIGTGNLASAVIGGAVRSGRISGEAFIVYDIFSEKARACCERFGASAADSAQQIAETCDVVILAVKPKDFAALLSALSPALEANDPLIVSVAAGLSIEYLTGFLGYAPRIARIMTNINAAVCGAMTAYCVGARVTAQDAAFLDSFCKSFGDAIALEESLFAQFGVLAGCVPAFAYKFVDEIARAGVQIGVRKDLALRIAAQTVLGSAQVVAEDDAHPYALIDRVCTPGGTTIDGIAALDALGFNDAVHQAVVRSFEKDIALAKAKEKDQK